MSLAAYLAKNYLNSSKSSTADQTDLSNRPKKRRKKEKTAASSTLIIADDDDDLLLRTAGAYNETEEDRPIFDESYHSAEFRKAKKNNWKSLNEPDSKSATAAQANFVDDDDDDTAQEEADRILARAAADQAAHAAAVDQDDAPAVVDEAGEHDSANVPKMSSGVRAGLQTAADTERLEAEEARKREEEEREQKALRRRKKKDKARGEEDTAGAEEEQTVYRDATGRRIDISMKRAEARAAEQAKLAAERKEKESAMGEVQRLERERKKQDLEEAKFLTVARGADDEAMNEELKEKLRWDDPMAAYMAQKRVEEDDGGGGGGGRSAGNISTAVKRASQTKARRKEYAGAAAPNRYGIRPGWRWDGVDRGNGFEKEWFQARGKQARTRDLEYQWQMDE